MDYFTQLPVVQYTDLQGGNTQLLLTNILSRSAFLREVVENTALFYEYSVKDGETPEIIADKLYGDPKRFWIVLLFNQLSNPYYDFPLVQEQLHSFIESKYGQTIAQSQTTIHHYEERVKRTIYYNGTFQYDHEDSYTISALVQNANGIAVARPGLPGVADTSLAGDSITENFGSGVTVTTEYTYVAISNYTYELNENEKKRNIKLLDATYVVPVENELRRLMRNGN